MEVKQLAKEVLEFLESQYDRNTFKFRFDVSYSFDGDEEIWLNVCDKDGKVIKVITNNFLKYIFNITPMEYIEERKMWLWQKELIDEIEGS
jgi:hypothetical protein